MLIPVLHLLPPECAHRVAIQSLKLGLMPRRDPTGLRRLRTSVAGLSLPNPLGLAAGFDKNAEAVSGLAKTGFGWLEVGTITPKPQSGNPKPRLFRLVRDRALINRMGFNNGGMEAARRRLAGRDRSDGVVGANIGANRTSKDPVGDYVACLQALYPVVDYVTINVSSPNTPGLRDLQARARLTDLLQSLLSARSALVGAASVKPLFLKIAPDLEADDEADVAEVATALGIDGLIIGNTTTARPTTLVDPRRGEAGGLSGRPLFEPSTAQLRRFFRLTGGALPLIGVGGIESGAGAFAKIQAGASAVQLLTGLIYQGPAVIARILAELDQLLDRGGFTRLSEAVGSGVGSDAPENHARSQGRRPRQ